MNLLEQAIILITFIIMNNKKNQLKIKKKHRLENFRRKQKQIQQIGWLVE